MTNQPYRIVEGSAALQGSPEWLAWRRGRITASMCGTILGLNPYETPLQLYSKILSGEETPDNERMAHGRETEAEARSWVIHQTGIGYAPMCMESIECPWMACSLDGWNQHAEVKAVEIKCPMKSIDQLNSMVDVPQNYFCQMQHQMAVTGIEKMYYVTYSKSSQDGVIITVKRDDLFIEKMIPLLKAFYDRLAAFDPPNPIEGRDIIEINDPEAIDAANSYKEIKGLIENLEKQSEGLREFLIKKAEGRSIRVQDLKVTKVIRKGNVDYSKIEALKYMDLEPYRKPNSVSWRFT